LVGGVADDAAQVLVDDEVGGPGEDDERQGDGDHRDDSGEAGLG
jgi:hypothetical protein